jgi:hypothetical protein
MRVIPSRVDGEESAAYEAGIAHRQWMLRGC